MPVKNAVRYFIHKADTMMNEMDFLDLLQRMEGESLDFKAEGYCIDVRVRRKQQTFSKMSFAWPILPVQRYPILFWEYQNIQMALMNYWE